MGMTLGWIALFRIYKTDTNIITVMKKILICLILLTAYTRIYAQEEVTDTLTVHPNDDGQSEKDTLVPLEGVLPTGQTPKRNETGNTIPGFFFPLQYYSSILPGQTTLANWSSGSLTAAGQTAVMPGMMAVDGGEIILRQQMGNFTLEAYGAANHYGYFRGLDTQWGAGGSLTYQVNDNLSLTAFGAYYTSTGIMQPAIMGYVNYPVYGGYANYRFNKSRFGIKVGAQSYYDPLRKAWEAQPIAMPYYHFNGGDLGIDVGGILFQLLQDHNMKRNPGNPTIAPAKANPTIKPININR
jgi:hypothetical protein